MAQARTLFRSTEPAGALAALAAALLWGLSTPAAKFLTAQVQPIIFAALLYLGFGLGLGAWWLARRLFWRHRHFSPTEAPLARRDFPWLAASIAAGGLVGPVLLMAGLACTPAATASLLLNVELVFTVLLAWFVFGEHFSRRTVAGIALILAGGALVSWVGWPTISAPWAPVAIAGACFCWALDSNLTRKISAGDPLQIAVIRGLVAGTINLAVGLLAGERLPPAGPALACGAIGLVGYGCSLVFFILALRHVGAARTGAYFATAPFVGAVAAFILFAQWPSPLLLAAAVLMAAGLALHLFERHDHLHEHEPLCHAHRHIHDEHHRHEHAAAHAGPEPHAHEHAHAPLRHGHSHRPDLHHRHGH